MSIHKFFTEDIVIQRLKTTSGNKKTFQSTATVDGHIQELDRQARQKLGIIEEKVWEAWVDIDEDIQEGDRMINEDNVIFFVKEVAKKDYGSNTVNHLQLILLEASE